MASQQQIKRRIGSVRNTRQITRAMQLVAASKLRRAQLAVVGPREYSRVARQILTHLRQVSEGSGFPLFQPRPVVKHRLYIVIASDRSLAGAYNSNIIRTMVGRLQRDKQAGVGSEVLAVGRQAANAASRLQGVQMAGVYTGFPDKPSANQLRPILTTLMERFESGEVDEVEIIFTDYVTSITQRVDTQIILPAGFEETDTTDLTNATIEPNVEVLLANATERLLEAQLYQAYLESVTSEHAMRMLAMKNATDNASDIIDDLTLEFNNARQAAITQELAEISGGVEALNT